MKDGRFVRFVAVFKREFMEEIVSTVTLSCTQSEYENVSSMQNVFEVLMLIFINLGTGYATLMLQ